MKHLSILVLLFVASLCGGTANAQVSEAAREQFERAAKYIDEGKLDLATEVIDSLLTAYPGNHAALHEKGLILFAKKDYRQAADIFEILQEEPDATEMTYGMLGNCYDVLGRTDQAIATYRAGIDRFPDNGYCYNELGICYLAMQSYEDAWRTFNECIVRDPGHASAYYWCARMCAQVYNNPVGQLLYTDCFTLLGDNTARMSQLGESLRNRLPMVVAVADDGAVNIAVAVDSVMKPFQAANTMYGIMAASFLSSGNVNLGRFKELTQFRRNALPALSLMSEVEPVKMLYKIEQAGFWEAFCALQMRYSDVGAQKWVEENYETIVRFVDWFDLQDINCRSLGQFALGVLKE